MNLSLVTGFQRNCWWVVGKILTPKGKNRLSIFHSRKRLRLSGYDYAQPGAYFLTMCVQRRECLLGRVSHGEMHLTEYGKIAIDCWNTLPHHYPHVDLDAFAIMPNHVHGILFIRAGLKPAPTNKPITEIIRAFKTFSARKINQLRNTPGSSVWQRNFYEHVIRDDLSLQRIREYIETNPQRWALDRENPLRQGEDEFDRWLATFKDNPESRRGGFQTRP